MGLLLAAAFLFLPCAFSSSGVSRQSPLLKRHMAAPQRAGTGDRGGRWEDGCNPRQFRETLVSSLEDTGLPHFGARSHLLLDAETPAFLVQDDLQAHPGDAEGGSHVGCPPPQAVYPAEEEGEVWWPSSLSWPAPHLSHFHSTRPVLSQGSLAASR